MFTALLFTLATVILVFLVFPSYYKSSEFSKVRYEKKGPAEVIQPREKRRQGVSGVSTPKKVYDAMKSSKPHLKLGFVHMRKSGGTHINHILSEFMYEHGCMATGTDVVVQQKVGVRGVRSGIPMDMIDPKYHLNYTKHPPKCQQINYIHEEMMSFHGKYFLDMKVPMRGERKDKSFSLLTTIRDPIERIGSQAFYGKYSVARTTVNDIIRNSNDSGCEYYKNLQKTKQGFNPIAESEICSTKNVGARLVACNCFNKAMNQTKEIIRTNETVWFNWIKNVVGYQDEYLSNYFVKRLVATTSEPKYQGTFAREFKHSQYCISTANCTNDDQYEILSGIFQTTPGFGFDRAQHPVDESEYDVNVALNISKTLLRDHFDFIIMDYFNEPRSTVALSRAFHSSLFLSEQLKENDNSGVFNPASANSTHAREYTARVMRKESKIESSKRSLMELLSVTKNSKIATKAHLPWVDMRTATSGEENSRRRLSTSYRSGMPQSVLRYLEMDNFADIKLYEFALQEFERRSVAELWSHTYYHAHDSRDSNKNGDNSTHR